MSNELQGVISAVSRKERDTKWGKKEAISYQINGDWYSGGFKKWGNVDKGDEVVIEFDVSPQGWKNITNVTCVARANGGGSAPAKAAPKSSGRYRGNGEAGGFPLDPLCYERALDRRNALTNAVATLGSLRDVDNREDYTTLVIKIARAYEAYTTGDLDREEAIAMLGGEDD